MNPSTAFAPTSPVRANAFVALAAGTLAAAIAAIPASLRVSTPFEAWVVLAGGTAAILGPALAGVSQLGPLKPGLFSVLTGLGISAIPIALFAAKLKLLTHHRPLGAVSLAVGATLIVFCAVLLAMRVTTWRGGGAIGPASRAWMRAGLAWFALAGPALLLGSAVSAPAARTAALDAGLAFACTALLALSPWPAPVVRAASRAGLAVWAALVLSGLLVLSSDLDDSVRPASPALVAPFSWFVY